MTSILVLGINGMLGHEVAKVLDKDGFTVYGLDRNNLYSINGTFRTKMADGIDIHNPEIGLSRAYEIIPNITTVVNAIGMIKPRMQNLDIPTTKEAIVVNVKFPYFLTRFAEKVNSSVYQIATDCVYSGKKGMYIESDFHDATDVYGKTKSLGEVPSENVMHLRSSIIGPEVGRATSLLEWFMNQPKDAQINGFSDHLWNGITTHQFAKVSLGIAKSNWFNQGVHHIIPSDIVTKAELLNIFSETYNRKDIKINETLSSNHVDRTLSTNQKELNSNIWELGGYISPPTIAEMVYEQASFNQLL